MAIKNRPGPNKPEALARWKVAHAPLELGPEDIAALAQVDPWLAKAATKLKIRARERQYAKDDEIDPKYRGISRSIK